ncbi:MAG: glycosyltransferase family 2 protein [Cyclobacteriaceae bacterium]|nr:glycosyltransferase family 2 protein [Cyclobacteriaceae bacterium]
MSRIGTFVHGIFPEQWERRLRDFRDEYLRTYHHEKLPQAIYDTGLKQHSISFCTTCMNRFFHLRKTIIRNMESNIRYKRAEFVLVNYNSQDGLHEWAKKNLRKYIDAGILNYYYTPEPKFFHVSIAKNIAHRMAKGEFVCNVDGDNFTGKDFAFYLNYLINQFGIDSLFHFRKKPFWGTEGRVALSKAKFLALGGYDESFFPTGHEDHDLINRARAYGMPYHVIEIENFLHYLSNSTREKSKNFEDPNAYYYNYESANRETSNRNIARGELVANGGILPAVAVYKNFTDELV